MIMMIDPPSGWKYGFPKEASREVYESEKLFIEWLLENGYPNKNIPIALKHSRAWEVKS